MSLTQFTSHRSASHWALLIIVIIGFLIMPIDTSTAQTPSVHHGVIDLQDWDFNQQGIVDLSGDWRFDWPAEQPSSLTSDFMQVPGIWNNADSKLPEQGFATYRLTVLIDDWRSNYALRLKEIFSAYRLIVNGEILLTVGKVATQPQGNVPLLSSHVVSITPATKQLDIELQVANFHYKDGGIKGTVEFGTLDQIQSRRELSLIIDSALWGSLVIMALYHFALFYQRREDTSTLLFGAFCVLIAVRIPLVNDIFILDLYPNLSWEHRLKLLVFSYFLAVPTFIAYINQLFRQELKQRIIRWMLTIGIASSAIVLLTPPSVFTRIEAFYQGFIMICACYVSFYLFKALFEGKEGVKWIVLGTTLLLIAVLNDVLYAQHVTWLSSHQSYVPFGVFIFIFSQSYVLSVRYSRAHTNATIDMLCQVLNRNRFLELSEAHLKHYHRSKKPFSILMIDADHFKKVNDTYGHEVGDLVLKGLCNTFKSMLDKRMLLARMGGEEFALLLPNTKLDQAFEFAEKIRAEVARKCVASRGNEIFTTVSIGVAEVAPEHTVSNILREADLALYDAKRNGRNRVSAQITSMSPVEASV